MQTKRHFYIVARRWFQKTRGNTYHSVSIIENGHEFARAGCSYGYGDHWMQTALILLSRNTVTLEDAPLLSDRQPFTIEYQVIDVQRKKDL
jgi:hypothetical protein